MRSLLRGERRGSPLTVLAFVALIGLGAYFGIAAASWRNQFYDLKHTIYTRCVQRSAYDEASQAARSAQEDYYRRLLRNIRSNAQRDRFYRQLNVSAERVVHQLHHALVVGAPRGCSQYR